MHKLRKKEIADLKKGKSSRVKSPLGAEIPHLGHIPMQNLHLSHFYVTSAGGFSTFIAYTLFSFTEDFSAIIVLTDDIFKSNIYQLI
jgi:hypothetical protein